MFHEEHGFLRRFWESPARLRSTNWLQRGAISKLVIAGLTVVSVARIGPAEPLPLTMMALAEPVAMRRVTGPTVAMDPPVILKPRAKRKVVRRKHFRAFRKQVVLAAEPAFKP